MIVDSVESLYFETKIKEEMAISENKIRDLV
jgi:hypothetical protein